MLTPEQKAVVDAINSEHRAFWMKDVATFERHHLRSPELLRWGYWQAGGMMMRRGWDEIGPRSLDHMRRLPHPVPEFAEAPLHNLILHVRDDMAWASYERVNPRVHLPPSLGPNGPTHNIRILEKHDGRWLIAATVLLDAHLGDEVAVRVAEDGTVVWASSLADEQLKFDEHFAISLGRLRTRHRRHQSKLSSIVSWVASLDRHLMPSRAAMPLFLERDSGTIRTIWIIADMACALVVLDDVRSVTERIAMAVQAFGLSPSQTRLAISLLEGQTLANYAVANGVTPNTARTHLKRMFDKVGVSNQVGLVRALVSLSPPR